MRVIRLAWDYPVDENPTFGLQPVYYYLSKEQARLGYDVHVITKGKGGEGVEVGGDGVTVHRVPDPFSLNAYRAVKSLKINRGRAIIHSHATCGVFLAATKRVIGLPLVSQVHGCSHSAHMPITLRFGDSVLGNPARENLYRYIRERSLWSTADRILAVSESVKTDLGTSYGIPRNRVDVVFNGVDTSIFKPHPGLPSPPQLRQFQGKRIVLYVGHFGLRKGIVFLIQAMKSIVKEVPDAVLVCVGGVPKWLGTQDYWHFLERCIAENGLEGKVLLLDKVPNAELPAFYSAAEVFVLPSYYEAFAKVLVEAMACGKPVVVTKGGGPAETIKDGENGLVVDFGSAEQIKEAVVKILEESNLKRKLAKNAVDTVEKNLTWRAVAARISQAYRRVLVPSKA